MAKAYNQRPSSYLDIADPYLAFCLDEACFEWGAYIDSELDLVEGNSTAEITQKRERIFRRLMGLALKYADPAAILGDKKSYVKKI